MPFYPSFDDDAWWSNPGPLRLTIHPQAPVTLPSNTPLVPGGTYDDWSTRNAPLDDGYPDDWIYPDDGSALAPLAPPVGTPAGSNGQSNQTNITTSGQTAQPAPASSFSLTGGTPNYWSLIPASRIGALAWDPPVLPDAFGRFPSINVPPLELPRGLGSGGILGGIPQMLADRAAANDPWTAARSSIVGAFADPPAGSNASSTFGQGGILGALANLRPSAPSPQVSAGFAGDPQPFLLPNATGFQGQGGNSLLLRVADPSEEPGLEKEPHEDELKRKLEVLDPFGPHLPGTGPVPPVPLVRSSPAPPPAAPRGTPQAPQAQPGSPRASSAAPNSSPVPTTVSAGQARVPQSAQLGSTAPELVPPLGAQPSPLAPPVPTPVGRGRQYELKKGSQQTTVRVKINAREVTLRLDNPPDDNGVKELKDYKWSSPGYRAPFIQQQVIKDFQTQIRNYQVVHPRVRLQFSEQPPAWIQRAIEEVGGTYFVDP